MNNYLYFMSTEKEPLDDGSLRFIGPKLIRVNTCFHVVMPIRNNQHESMINIVTIINISFDILSHIITNNEKMYLLKIFEAFAERN